ncbi:hypothetical protein Btru_044419 [Bulinus truncatus]|nr:hypothetical protein Btru_044419 [Bulinus truncatus]
MDILLKDADLCIPLCRKEIFSDVCGGVHGDIDRVWVLPGHFFMTTDKGKKLFTFDCKPLSHQHVFDSRNLDLTCLSGTLLDVFMITPEIAAVIEINGHIQFWKFGTNFSWILIGNVALCTPSQSEIFSVTYLKSLNCVVWCETRKSDVTTSCSESSRNCIYKRELPKEIISQDELDHTSTSILLDNCSPCDVVALSADVLLVTTRYNPDQISMHLLFDFPHEVINIFIGSNHVIHPVKSANDFQDIIANNFSLIIKAELGRGNLGIRTDVAEGQVAILHSDLCVEVYTCFSESPKRNITRHSAQLSFPTNETLSLDNKHWFLHKGHIGIFIQNTVHIFRLNDAKHMCQSDLLASKKICQVISSQHQLVLAWILTSDQILALQAIKIADKEFNSDTDEIPDEHTLQTDILRLVQLQELKLKDYKYETVLELQEIRKRCTDLKNIQGHLQIASFMAPYLEHYWKLESIANTIVDSKMVAMLPESKPTMSVVQRLMESRNFATTSRHSKLLWLSQIYPQELLDYLCDGISLDNTQVESAEIKKWQHLLGQDGGDLLNFEFVCKLLFQLYPEKLLNFVKCAESVSEYTVGVSAFVRKKHSLIYCKAACECLPPNNLSCNPPLAASVKAKLILASDTQGCVEKSLKHLLQHKLWLEAVQLVQQNVADKEKLSLYLHITITALAQNKVLLHFVPHLFAIFPSWKSLISFSNIAAEQTEIRQQQLSFLAKDVFLEHAPDLKLASVKPHLLELIKKMNAE